MKLTLEILVINDWSPKELILSNKMITFLCNSLAFLLMWMTSCWRNIFDACVSSRQGPQRAWPETVILLSLRLSKRILTTLFSILKRIDRKWLKVYDSVRPLKLILPTCCKISFNNCQRVIGIAFFDFLPCCIGNEGGKIFKNPSLKMRWKTVLSIHFSSLFAQPAQMT